MASVSQLGYFQKSGIKRENRFPKLPLYSALALLAFSVAAVVFGQATGIGTIKNQFGEPVAIRDLVLTRDDAGNVLVLDARTNVLLASYDENGGGFVSGSLRGLERMRFTAKIPATEPYRVIKWQNGAISLSDTVTGERLYLNAFGKDNAAAFEKFLTSGKAADTAALQHSGETKGEGNE